MYVVIAQGACLAWPRRLHATEPLPSYPSFDSVIGNFNSNFFGVDLFSIMVIMYDGGYE